MDQEQNAPLREDVHLLDEELGAVLRQQAGEQLFDTVETIRQVAVESRSQGEMPLKRLRQLLDPLDDEALLEVARAFSQFLSLANIAEQRHRERLSRHQ
ncbi:phosphoenolpyruvate carboxylase [Microbulbifer taiwanensis]|uniref:Phosphoenolpyruvate carboxylase n=1 Tax=Microbulbifer taiwanensis TaxID=986746 RepID=A0ABW1YQ15_9GAMM|nr:phosphoenolpyruvate carboxylase [Microbulbifer taiwanensis]